MDKQIWRYGLAAFALGLGLAAPAALAGGNGTALSIVATSDTPVCSGNLCSADIAATATTSGSTAAAAVLVSTDGGQTFSNVGTVATTDWVGSGRAKLAEEAIPITGLPAGATTVVTVCFLQPGANGDPLKRACADVAVTTPSPCVNNCSTGTIL